MAELTTVADDEAVVHDGTDVRRYGGLTPDTDYEHDGFAYRTLPAPGELLSRFATVNDVHFGETVCGELDGYTDGPVFSVEPGAEPYPEVMNRGAIAEIQAIEPDAVVAKGDLTAHGSVEEYQRFVDFYGEAFADRLHHVRGNHDGYAGESFAVDAPVAVDLAGVRLAILDTVIPRDTPGQVSSDQR